MGFMTRSFYLPLSHIRHTRAQSRGLCSSRYEIKDGFIVGHTKTHCCDQRVAHREKMAMMSILLGSDFSSEPPGTKAAAGL